VDENKHTSNFFLHFAQFHDMYGMLGGGGSLENKTDHLGTMFGATAAASLLGGENGCSARPAQPKPKGGQARLARQAEAVMDDGASSGSLWRSPTPGLLKTI
jgi:hypothetical protein